MTRLLWPEASRYKTPLLRSRRTLAASASGDWLLHGLGHLAKVAGQVSTANRPLFLSFVVPSALAVQVSAPEVEMPHFFDRREDSP